MQAALLPERGVVKLAGPDARHFLNNIVTNDLGRAGRDGARFAALLTPQGKIIADFIAAEIAPAEGDGFFLDCPKALAETLTAKLTFYRLRAKVTIENLSDALGVLAIWGGDAATLAKADSEYGLCYSDPRLSALGLRMIVPANLASETAADLGAALVDAADYDAHRIALGVPRGGQDFSYLDTFPHEADMDQLAGIDFAKGCYIGQEVVSRVEHRSAARNRVVPVRYDGPAPAPGAEIAAGDKPVGVMGSAVDGKGLALLRLDRVGDALAAGTAITAGGVTLRAVKPAWATFAWPERSKAAS